MLKRLREWTRVPVVVLSVRDREDDKIAALDNGADDYDGSQRGLHACPGVWFRETGEALAF